MVNEHLYPVIIAGGSGTRLWPLSRKKRPKQFMPIGVGDDSLLSATIKRSLSFARVENIYIVCGQVHADIIFKELPQIRPDQVLIEPMAKNTAPAIAYAASVLQQKDPDAVMVVLPADHYIPQTDYPAFAAAVELASQLADNNYLMTFGIKPTEPATGYGYIETADALSLASSFKVKAFHEKPDLARAQNYVAGGKHFWNSGIFVWRAADYLQELAKYEPEIVDLFARRGEGLSPEVLRDIFNQVKSISVDYAVLERSDKVGMVAASFAWNDVGALDALADFLPVVGNNKADAKLVSIASENNLVSSDGALVALLGVDDLIVVKSGDAILVAKKSMAQDVKKIVEALGNNNNLKGYL